MSELTEQIDYWIDQHGALNSPLPDLIRLELAQKDAQIQGLVDALEPFSRFHKRTIKNGRRITIPVPQPKLTNPDDFEYWLGMEDFKAVDKALSTLPTTYLERYRLERDVLEAAEDLDEEWSDHNIHRLCHSVSALQAHKGKE